MVDSRHGSSLAWRELWCWTLIYNQLCPPVHQCPPPPPQVIGTDIQEPVHASVHPRTFTYVWRWWQRLLHLGSWFNHLIKCWFTVEPWSCLLLLLNMGGGGSVHSSGWMSTRRITVQQSNLNEQNVANINLAAAGHRHSPPPSPHTHIPISICKYISVSD